MRTIIVFGAGFLMCLALFIGRQSVDAADTKLPAEIFAEGKRVHGLGATWQIDEVRGGWVKARLYRTLDENPASPHEARWIYIPAVDGSWTAAVDTP